MIELISFRSGSIRKLACGLLLAVLTVSSSPALEIEARPVMAKRFARALSCEAGKPDTLRHWCAATMIGAADFKRPTEQSQYLGLSVFLKNDDDNVRSAILDQTTFSVLNVGPAGARLTSLKGSNPEQEKEVWIAMIGAIAALKGLPSDTVEVSADLWSFLQSERGKPLHPFSSPNLSTRFGEFSAKLPSLIYSVSAPPGIVYVVVEAATDGQYVSVFPALKVGPQKK